MKYFCLFAVGVSLALGLSARADLVSGVSIVVNEEVITYGEISDKVARSVGMLSTLYPNDQQRLQDEAAKVRDQQIEDMVERKLILHEFAANGYVTNVLESMIDDQVKRNI